MSSKLPSYWTNRRKIIARVDQHIADIQVEELHTEQKQHSKNNTSAYASENAGLRDVASDSDIDQEMSVDLETACGNGNL